MQLGAIRTLTNVCYFYVIIISDLINNVIFVRENFIVWVQKASLRSIINLSIIALLQYRRSLMTNMFTVKRLKLEL
jgi:hypothetical protein